MKIYLLLLLSLSWSTVNSLQFEDTRNLNSSIEPTTTIDNRQYITSTESIEATTIVNSTPLVNYIDFDVNIDWDDYIDTATPIDFTDYGWISVVFISGVTILTVVVLGCILFKCIRKKPMKKKSKHNIEELEAKSLSTIPKVESSSAEVKAIVNE